MNVSLHRRNARFLNCMENDSDRDDAPGKESHITHSPGIYGQIFVSFPFYNIFYFILNAIFLREFLLFLFYIYTFKLLDFINKYSFNLNSK